MMYAIIVLMVVVVMSLAFLMLLLLALLREGGLKVTEIHRDQEGRIQAIIQKGW